MKFACAFLSMTLACAFVAGCAGSQSPAGGMSPSLAQPGFAAVHGDRGRSWMSPAAKKQSLLYVSSVLSNDVYVYALSTQKLVGTLTDFSSPYGLCVDKSANVWVVNDGAQDVVEYAHGGTSPLATLSDPGEYPEGCSVDRTTGNLAVTNFYSSSGGGSVSIYAGAKGTAQTYTDSDLEEYRFCGYDSNGNLFVDGETSGGAFAFAELPKGGSTFTNITIAQTIEWPGGVQWDGKYVAVGDTDTGIIYRIEGTKGTVKAKTTLEQSDYVNQFWIAESGKRRKGTVIAPNQDGGSVGIYPYPAGGAPTTTITVSEPFGATVSL